MSDQILDDELMNLLGTDEEVGEIGEEEEVVTDEVVEDDEPLEDDADEEEVDDTEEEEEDEDEEVDEDSKPNTSDIKLDDALAAIKNLTEQVTELKASGIAAREANKEPEIIEFLESDDDLTEAISSPASMNKLLSRIVHLVNEHTVKVIPQAANAVVDERMEINRAYSTFFMNNRDLFDVKASSTAEAQKIKESRARMFTKFVEEAQAANPNWQKDIDTIMTSAGGKLRGLIGAASSRRKKKDGGKKPPIPITKSAKKQPSTTARKQVLAEDKELEMMMGLIN